LTAAHCDWNFETNMPWNAKSLRKEPVRVGAIANSTWSSVFQDGRRRWTIDTLFEDGAIEVPVFNQSYYPGYDATTNVGDFLLLHLDKKVCIDGPPLSLNEDPLLPGIGASLAVLGMGLIRQDATFGVLPSQLMDTTFNVLAFDACTALREEAADILAEELDQNITLSPIDDASMICTIYVEDGDNVGGQSACNGDSGGPVVYMEEDGNHTLMGVVSFGYQVCGVDFYPDVIARVSFAMDWIKMTVCDEWGEDASFCPMGVTSCDEDDDSHNTGKRG
jgi:hypothetical protein